MIAVIADDLTGAAELGGLGLRYGLDVEINTKINPHSKADLLVIAGDSRSKNKKEAVEEMIEITAKVAQFKPKLIYKKVDSVLRGHVIAELTAQLKELKLKKALLVPANPGLGRTIRNGTYYLNDEPIHLSSFSKDPEFAINSSSVLDMLRVNGFPVEVRKKEEGLLQEGIAVGEAVSSNDLKEWAAQIDDSTLLAGASGFFTAILDKIQSKSSQQYGITPPEFSYPALYVSGTTFNKKIEAIRKIKNNGGPVSYMPSQVIASPNPTVDAYNQWADEVGSLLSKHKKAIIAIDPETAPQKETALSLRTKTACAVEKIFDQIYIRELVVEGGSTGAAIIKRLNFNSFFPVQEVSPGVIRMSVEDKDDLFLTLKPGSYDWSPEIWNF
jgi:D-threonate/D-erythronate kinase